jgi:hypothetical protein
MSDTMQFIDIKIPDLGGSLSERLDGAFTEKSLADKLIEHWVPYVNCHRKCLAASICQFVQKPHSEDKCGFKAKAIVTFVELSFKELKSRNPKDIQKMLMAGFHITEFMYVSQFYSGMMVGDASKAFRSFLGKSMIFQVINLRDHLNAAATLVSDVVDDFTKTSIIFVEGESEKVLLSLLKKKISLINDNMKIESYDGHGNAQPKRAAMLIQSRINEGYVVRVQGDRDGHVSSSIDKLKTSLNLNTSQVFAFKYDLESSYPPQLLAKVLGKLGLLNTDQIDNFSYDCSVSVSKYILNEFSVDVSPMKVRIAELVVEELIESVLTFPSPDDIFFSENELGRFILFCSWWSNAE